MSDISLVGESQCRVSSVLGRNTRELGKQHLFDGSAETCWNSDQGVPQWVALRWPSPVQVTTIIAQFQGGFCGADNTVVEVPQGEGSSEWHTAHSWPLEDIGTPQTLHLAEPLTTTSLRLTFPSSTDFFGRIIMYKLDVLGKKLWFKLIFLWCPGQLNIVLWISISSNTSDHCHREKLHCTAVAAH